MPVRLGADGLVDFEELSADPVSCAADLCNLNKCALMCSFIGLLPSGPLWDRAKDEAMGYYLNQQRHVDPCDAQCSTDLTCLSLVNHAIYTANKLWHHLMEILWPRIREASPHTAVTTLDLWLDRLGWQDCYRSACRTLVAVPLAPYETMGECGPIFHDLDFGTDLECAIKRGVIRSLSRLQMGIIPNIDSINWVIEPLGAYISPTDPDVVDPEDCCNNDMTICNISDTIEACLPTLCHEAIKPPVIAYYLTTDSDPEGLPPVIWPAVLAAECIVRAILGSQCPNNIHRCSGEPTEG